MNQKERKVVFTLIGVMVLILLIVVIVKSTGRKEEKGNTQNTQTNEEKYVTQLSDGTKLNKSDDLQKAKTYKGVEISNLQFSYTEETGNSVLLADLKNTSSSDTKDEDIIIVLQGENGETIKEVVAWLPAMKAGETKELNCSFSADIVNVKDFSIRAK